MNKIFLLTLSKRLKVKKLLLRVFIFSLILLTIGCSSSSSPTYNVTKEQIAQIEKITKIKHSVPTTEYKDLNTLLKDVDMVKLDPIDKRIFLEYASLSKKDVCIKMEYFIEEFSLNTEQIRDALSLRISDISTEAFDCYLMHFIDINYIWTYNNSNLLHSLIRNWKNSNDNKVILEYLINSDVDTHLRAMDGKTPIDLVKESGNKYLYLTLVNSNEKAYNEYLEEQRLAKIETEKKRLKEKEIQIQKEKQRQLAEKIEKEKQRKIAEKIEKEKQEKICIEAASFKGFFVDTFYYYHKDGKCPKSRWEYQNIETSYLISCSDQKSIAGTTAVWHDYKMRNDKQYGINAVMYANAQTGITVVNKTDRNLEYHSAFGNIRQFANGDTFKNTHPSILKDFFNCRYDVEVHKKNGEQWYEMVPKTSNN